MHYGGANGRFVSEFPDGKKADEVGYTNLDVTFSVIPEQQLLTYLRPHSARSRSARAVCLLWWASAAAAFGVP